MVKLVVCFIDMICIPHTRVIGFMAFSIIYQMRIKKSTQPDMISKTRFTNF